MASSRTSAPPAALLAAALAAAPALAQEGGEPPTPLPAPDARAALERIAGPMRRLADAGRVLPAPVLEPGEHLLADEALEAFARAVDDRTFAREHASFRGGYLRRNFLDTEQKRGRFREPLASAFEPGEIRRFEELLSTPGALVLARGLLDNRPELARVLLHERVHREMDRLAPNESGLLRRAYDDLMNRPELPVDPKEHYGLISSVPFVRERRVPGRPGGFYEVAVAQNWSEFYPYLANGVFEPRVLDALRIDHPEAFRLYDVMRARSARGAGDGGRSE
ncbi:MAG: hypothetical protein HY553_23170 [Elusimicrobia bacterium]|nr:hypothetical protein [Elusimicrobiota bacterium]